MATRRQELDIQGELLVIEACRCLRCGGAFRPLRKSTPCAVVRCIECGAPAQVRTRRSATTDRLPRKIMGGAWAPQAGLLLGDALHDLFVVLVDGRGRRAVHALPGSSQDARLFRRRDALAPELRAGGRQAFTYELQPFWPLFQTIEPDGHARHHDPVICPFPSLAQRERRKPLFTKLARPGSNVAFVGRDYGCGTAAAASNIVPISR